MYRKNREGCTAFALLICVFSLGAMAFSFAAEQKVTIEKIPYGGWENCYRMSNGRVELIATSDVGPRVIRLGFVGEENEFSESKSDLGKVGGNQWRIYGGHRLWVAPEATPRSYYPDNVTVEAKVDGNTLTLTAPPELDPSFKVNTGVQKEMQITMHPDGRVTVVHRITNVNLWPVELAPWALSVMSRGGRAILPAPDPKPHPEALLPVRRMAVWSYTNLGDPRLLWGRKYIVIRQDPSRGEPLKLGVGNEKGWVAYARSGHLFLKLYDYIEEATYADLGSNTELWTNAQILEVETLGPLTTLAPKETVEHAENWFLFEGVEVTDDESTIDANVLPRVRDALKKVR
jgi:hypothetical protein